MNNYIALVGNQNSGKTTLFNLLTGLNQKIGNWPGVTVEKKEGIIKNTNYILVDLPGIYSLSSYSSEEEIASKYILEEKPKIIINIIDATCLERSLYLTSQLLEIDTKIIVVLNMVDILERKGIKIDEKMLEEKLGVRVCRISALKETGIDDLVKAINETSGDFSRKRKYNFYHANLENKIINIERNSQVKENKRFWAIKKLEENEALEEEIATERYEYISVVKKQCLKQKKKWINSSDMLDKIFLNKIFAIPIFMLIMFGIYFLSVGVVGKYTIDVINNFMGNISNLASIWLQNIGVSSWLKSLIVDGILKGISSVISFVPQLMILFLCISILETSGYMSRIAFLLDKIFRKIGLSGESLIPFIVGSGCSVPGILSTKIIENEDEKKMTSVLVPFIPCSAKLPIIALFSSYFFKENAGIISGSLYFLSIIIIILSAKLMKKYIFVDISSVFISELPEYKLPDIKYVAKDVLEKTFAFIKKAGTTILLASMLIWFLLSFSTDFKYGVSIENSILAFIGKKISWIFYPMIGVNSWEAAVSSLQGLIAKEQVISSMAIISGFEESQIQNTIFAQNSPFGFFTQDSAYSYIVFNLFSAPCFAAIGTMKKELGGTFKTICAVTYQIVLAWCLATLIYNVTR